MRSLLIPSLLALSLVTSSCQPSEARAGTAESSAPRITHGICHLVGTKGNESVRGWVRFTEESGGLRIQAEVEGLKPGRHGFHVHEWGDITCGTGTCTGGHFNPTGTPHGGPDAEQRHAGDFGNLEADDQGIAKYDRLDKMASLNGPHSILGRGIIVHADPDDLTSQPTGNAGARIANGVVGIAEPPKGEMPAGNQEGGKGKGN